MTKHIVSEKEIAPRPDRGGTFKALITRATVGASQLILGTAEVPVGDRVKPHAHDYSEETFFVVSGTGRLRLEGLGVYDFKAGDACFVPRGVVHEIENLGDGVIEVVFASAPLAPRPQDGHREASPKES